MSVDKISTSWQHAIASFSHILNERATKCLISSQGIITESAFPMQVSRYSTTSFFLICLEVLVLLRASNRKFDSFLCSMCWPYVLTSTSLFSTTKDGSKEDGVCSFRNRFSTKPRKHNSSLEASRYSYFEDSLRLMVKPKVLMVVHKISHRNTLHTVTNDFFWSCLIRTCRQNLSLPLLTRLHSSLPFPSSLFAPHGPTVSLLDTVTLDVFGEGHKLWSH